MTWKAGQTHVRDVLVCCTSREVLPAVLLLGLSLLSVNTRDALRRLFTTFAR